jgi:para-nitrobenzyl esterase
MLMHAPNKTFDIRLMIDKDLRIALAAAILCTASVFPAAAAIQRVNVVGGTLEGRIDDGVASFKGVPFAAPPIGELRWRAPQAVIPWIGLRKAEAFALPCAQPQHDGIPDSNEDCLYLNVWTGAKSSKDRRPVMVWIYGGSLHGRSDLQSDL